MTSFSLLFLSSSHPFDGVCCVHERSPSCTVDSDSPKKRGPLFLSPPSTFFRLLPPLKKKVRHDSHGHTQKIIQLQQNEQKSKAKEREMFELLADIRKESTRRSEQLLAKMAAIRQENTRRTRELVATIAENQQKSNARERELLNRIDTLSKVKLLRTRFCNPKNQTNKKTQAVEASKAKENDMAHSIDDVSSFFFLILYSLILPLLN